MAAKSISLRELRNHVKTLDRLVTDAWFNSDVPAQISFADVREHAAAISALVADNSTSPHAATATKSPAAATDNGKSTAEKRAAYASAAADSAPKGLTAILSLSHTRRS